MEIDRGARGVVQPGIRLYNDYACAVLGESQGTQQSDRASPYDQHVSIEHIQKVRLSGFSK